MVPAAAHAQRAYFGPPRNEQEAAVQQRELASLRAFASEASAEVGNAAAVEPAAGAAGPAALTLEDVVASRASETRTPAVDPFAGAPDSDDEDAAGPSAKAGKHEGRQEADVDETVLAEELSRLAAAFDGADDDAPVPAGRYAMHRLFFVVHVRTCASLRNICFKVNTQAGDVLGGLIITNGHDSRFAVKQHTPAGYCKTQPALPSADARPLAGAVSPLLPLSLRLRCSRMQAAD